MNNILNLSEAVLIALHSMILIAKKNKINARNISKQIGASENHLSKILQRLVKSGFLKSNRGPSGGFILAKESKDISLLDVYEAIEGKIILTKCLFKNSVCSFQNCIFENINEKFQKEFIEDFKNKNLNMFL